MLHYAYIRVKNLLQHFRKELCIRQLPRDILTYSNVEMVSRQTDLYLSLAVAFAGAGYVQ